MKLWKIACLSAATLSVMALPAQAHHGTAGSYFMNQVVHVEGVVKEFHWRNPHSSLFVVAKNPAGQEVTYAFEMGSPATLSQAGYTRSSIKAGDTASLDMHPSRSSATNGYLPTSQKLLINGKQINRQVREDTQ